jgi:hypothetical protein
MRNYILKNICLFSKIFFDKKFYYLLILFFVAELKLLKKIIKNLKISLQEINYLNLFLSMITKKQKIDIFYDNNLNNFLFKISGILKKNISKKNKSKIIFVESFINHPLYTLPNCYLAALISKINKSECYGILRFGDIKNTKIMNAFGINKIIYINQGHIFKRLKYFLISYFYLRNIKKIKDLINLKLNKIEIGKSIYEQYIRFIKNPKVDKIENEFFFLLMEALIYNFQFDRIFKKFNGKYLVQSETQYFPTRMCIQNSLKYNTKVISRWGLEENGFKIFQDFSERNENRHKISEQFFNTYFNKYFEKNTKLISHISSKLLKKKFGKDLYQQLENKIINYNVISTKKELCKYFGWNLNNPIVAIYSHDFTDGNLDNKWNLFHNDMIWMKETIIKITNIKNVNWLIKPHPSEKIQNCLVTLKELTDKYSLESKNVKYLPENLLIKNINIYKAVITSHGTVGYELPAKGIPVIICGDAFYSSAGFNIQPKTKYEYFDILKNINKIKKPNKKEIQKCIFFYYFYNHLCITKNPIIYKSNIKMNYDAKKFWAKSYKILKNYKKFSLPYIRSLKHQLKHKNSISINLVKEKNLKI